MIYDYTFESRNVDNKEIFPKAFVFFLSFIIVIVVFQWH